ncbi:MAG: DUF3090 family protein [SAR202 cluster bacterium]|nr:DUF3090 family protein [SAR202 cluster bacterium]
MADPKLEFTRISTLRANALGEPGKRTFRIIAASGESTAQVWLEKEQLFQLALAINQLVETLPEVSASAPEDIGRREAPASTHVDFKVGKLVLGLYGANRRFIIDVHDIESHEEEPATIRIWGTQEQFVAFAEEAMQVCAAGRPLCPLCGQPLDPSGHACPRSNGHGVHDLTEVS